MPPVNPHADPDARRSHLHTVATGLEWAELTHPFDATTAVYKVAGRMFAAWGLTPPAAGIVGALCYWIQAGIGGALGTVVVFGILLATSAAIWVASRRKPVDHKNVNDDWDGATPEPAATPVPAVAAN